MLPGQFFFNNCSSVIFLVKMIVIWTFPLIPFSREWNKWKGTLSIAVMILIKEFLWTNQLSEIWRPSPHSAFVSAVQYCLARFLNFILFIFSATLKSRSWNVVLFRDDVLIFWILLLLVLPRLQNGFKNNDRCVWIYMTLCAVFHENIVILLKPTIPCTMHFLVKQRQHVG